MKDRVRFSFLKNGMPFYSHNDSISWCSGVGVRCGGIHTPADLVGLPHAIEHVIARGSRHHDPEEADWIYERYMGGPEANIEVATDLTSTYYGHDVLSRGHYMRRCFDMFAHMVRDKFVQEEGLLSELAAVRQEYYLRGKDVPEDIVDNLIHQTVYKINPVRRRVDCEPGHLPGMTKPAVKKFLRGQYKVNNMFVIMLGPPFREVGKLAERYFGDLKPGNVPPLDYDRSEDFPRITSPRIVQVVKEGISQYHFCLAYPTETYSSKDAEAIDVLARIWAWRCRRELRHKNRDLNKGVYRVLAYTPRTFLHGMIYLWWATSDKDFARESVGKVLRETRALRGNLVYQKEREAIVGNLEDQHRDMFKSESGTLADMIIEAVCNGDEELKGLHSFIPRLRRVSRSRLCEVANKYFTDNHVLVVVGPDELKL